MATDKNKSELLLYVVYIVKWNSYKQKLFLCFPQPPMQKHIFATPSLCDLCGACAE